MPIEKRRSGDIQQETSSNNTTHQYDLIRNKSKQAMMKNENNVSNDIPNNNRKRSEIGNYVISSRMELNEQELLKSFFNKNTHNSRNPCDRQEITRNEKEAHNKYKRLIRDERFIRDKQDKSAEQVNFKSLSGFNQKSIKIYIECCKKYGVKNTKELFNAGREINRKTSCLRYIKSNGDLIAYRNRLIPYEKDAFYFFKRYLKKFKKTFPAEQAWKDLHKIYLGSGSLQEDKSSASLAQESPSSLQDHPGLSHYLYLEYKSPQKKDNESDSEPQTHLNFDSSRHSGEPFEQSDPPQPIPDSSQDTGQPTTSAKEYPTTGAHNLTAESSKKRNAASDNESGSESHEYQSGNSGEPLEQSDPPHYSSRDPKRPKIGVRSLTKEDIQKREKQREWYNQHLESLESEDKLRYPSW